MPTKEEKQQFNAIGTTGHEWDGIQEYNNPLPRWWVWVFYSTIVFSIGYWILYPAWPSLSGYTKGVLGYSNRAAVAEKLEEARAAQADMRNAIAAASLEEIEQNPKLLEFALGRRQVGIRRQLRGLSWFGCCRFAGLSQPERRRLAVGRHA